MSHCPISVLLLIICLFGIIALNLAPARWGTPWNHPLSHPQLHPLHEVWTVSFFFCRRPVKGSAMRMFQKKDDLHNGTGSLTEKDLVMIGHDVYMVISGPGNMFNLRLKYVEHVSFAWPLSLAVWWGLRAFKGTVKSKHVVWAAWPSSCSRTHIDYWQWCSRLFPSFISWQSWLENPQ